MAKDSKKAPDTLPSPSFATPLAQVGKYSKGWIPDPVDTRDWSARAMLGAPRRRGEVRESLALVDFLRKVYDQDTTSGCTGFGIGAAVDTRLRALGVNTPEVSHQGIYTIGRAMARKSPDVPLEDTGAYPRSVMKGLKEYGVPRAEGWSFDPKTINDEPDQAKLQDASCAKVSAWSRVDTTGEGRAADVDHALSQKYPVALGIQCDQGFEDYDGKEEIGLPKGANYAGHMLCLLGFKTNRDGSKSYIGVNSWGLGWGLKGLFWMREERLVHPTTRDLYIIQVSG